MAAKDMSNHVVGRLDFPKIDGVPSDQNNIRFSFINTPENVDQVKAALENLDLADFEMEDLTPRNRYGRNGKPLNIKMAELKAQMEELEKLAAAEAETAEAETEESPKRGKK